LDQWAVYAEILCYQENDEEHCMVKTEVTELTSWLTVLQKQLDNCRSYIEAAEVPHLLWNLKGCANIPHGAWEPMCQGQHIHFNGLEVPF